LEKIGFYCWHNYTTNSKIIEVEAAEAKNKTFAYWQSKDFETKLAKIAFPK